MKISVCIPTYNQSDYLEITIRSVLNQAVKPFEIIVSNDCSTDQTKEVLAKLQKEISILRVINQPLNLGMNRNTDNCLRAASGNFILKLDSDDCILPGFLEDLSNLLIAHPNAGYAHAAIQEIDGEGKFLNVRRLLRATGYQESDYALSSCVKGYKVAANIILFRKSALQQVNFVTSNVSHAEDYYLSAEIAAAGFGNVYSEAVLACYRMWNDLGQVRQRRKLEEINGLRTIFEKVIRPAFEKRGWNSAVIEKSREKLAISHSSCMGWDVYSDAEKAELQIALKELSSTPRVKLALWSYKSGYGSIIQAYQNIIDKLRYYAKQFFFHVRKSFQGVSLIFNN